MRELKFRVWDKHNKKFYYWGYADGGFKGIPTNNTGMTMNYVKENTEQFTGLYDRNGKEIYEGDILDFDEREWGGKFTPEVVTNDSITGGWFLSGCFEDLREWREIIGNIHENPELLEVTDSKFTLPKTN